MKFTVFGSSGFIGSHLVRRLSSLGHEVITPDRSEVLAGKQPLGHVVYAIGLTADFRKQPFATVEAHVTLLASILERADFTSLLYLSSTRVYGSLGSGKEDASLQVHPEDPSDLYNLSKLMGESLCHQSGRQNVKVARLSNVVGPYRQGSENFLDSLICAAKDGKIELRSSPTSAKDYVHLEDVMDLLPKIATNGRWQTYNVASGRNTAHSIWTDTLHKLTGCEVTVSPQAPTLSFPSISIARIQDEFDFIPRAVTSDIPLWMPDFIRSH